LIAPLKSSGFPRFLEELLIVSALGIWKIIKKSMKPTPQVDLQNGATLNMIVKKVHWNEISRAPQVSTLAGGAAAA
jgi:hypothetical protein